MILHNIQFKYEKEKTGIEIYEGYKNAMQPGSTNSNIEVEIPEKQFKYTFMRQFYKFMCTPTNDHEKMCTKAFFDSSVEKYNNFKTALAQVTDVTDGIMTNE